MDTNDPRGWEPTRRALPIRVWLAVAVPIATAITTIALDALALAISARQSLQR